MRHMKPKSMLVAFVILSILFIGGMSMMSWTASYDMKTTIEVKERIEK